VTSGNDIFMTNNLSDPGNGAFSPTSSSRRRR
jgi:hypothetical protein